MIRMKPPSRFSFFSRLRENPIFLRDLGVGAGWRRKLSGLAGICFRVGILWLLLLAGMAGMILFSKDPPLQGQLPLVAQNLPKILLSPLLHFPLGFFFSYRRFRDARRSGFFRDIYFTRLSSPEILHGKLAALMLPPILLQATVIAGYMLFALVFGNPLENNPAIPAHLLLFGGYIQLFVFWVSSLYQIVAGVLALLGGVLGGMQMAMLGRPGKWMPTIALHLPMAFVTMCCCMFMALLYLPGYQRVRDEFWWHAVYLDQEDISRGGRMEG